MTRQILVGGVPVGGGAPVSEDEPVEPNETDFEEDTEA